MVVRTCAERLSKSVVATIHKSGIDHDNFLVPATVSSADIDRDGEIILPSAYAEDLYIYESNPILAWGHPLNERLVTPGPERILGCADSITVTESVLDCLFRYAVRENAMAKLCFDLVVGGFLKAYSIGAMMVEWVVPKSPVALLDALPEFARQALLDGLATCVHTRMELLEISQVFVGSNRDALVRALRDGQLSRVMANKALDMLKHGRSRDMEFEDALAEGLRRAVRPPVKTLKGEGLKLSAKDEKKTDKSPKQATTKAGAPTAKAGAAISQANADSCKSMMAKCAGGARAGLEGMAVAKGLLEAAGHTADWPGDFPPPAPADAIDDPQYDPDDADGTKSVKAVFSGDNVKCLKSAMAHCEKSVRSASHSMVVMDGMLEGAGHAADAWPDDVPRLDLPADPGPEDAQSTTASAGPTQKSLSMKLAELRKGVQALPVEKRAMAEKSLATVAKQHPMTADSAARLRTQANLLDSCWDYWWDGPRGDSDASAGDLPARGQLEAITAVVRDIADDLAALIAAMPASEEEAEPPVIPLTASPDAGVLAKWLLEPAAAKTVEAEADADEEDGYEDDDSDEDEDWDDDEETLAE